MCAYLAEFLKTSAIIYHDKILTLANIHGVLHAKKLRKEDPKQRQANTLDRYFQMSFVYGIHVIVIVLGKNQQLSTQKVM